MKDTDHASAIWVGPDSGAAFDRVASALRRHGVNLEMPEDVAQLREALRRSPRSVVVVCDRESAPVVDATLAALKSVYRSVPVIVLAEESVFGRYYDLMGRGVQYYYDLSETPEQIARAVGHTATRAA